MDRHRGSLVASEPRRRSDAGAPTGGASARDPAASGDNGNGKDGGRSDGSGMWKEDRGAVGRVGVGRRASEQPHRPSLFTKKPRDELPPSGDSDTAGPTMLGGSVSVEGEQGGEGRDGYTCRGAGGAVLSRDLGNRVRLARDHCRVGDLGSTGIEGGRESGSIGGGGDYCGGGDPLAATRGDGCGVGGRAPPRMRTIHSSEEECKTPCRDGGGAAISRPRLLEAGNNTGVSGGPACEDGARGGSGAAESTQTLRVARNPERWGFRTVVPAAGRERDARSGGGGIDGAVVGDISQDAQDLLTITAPELSPSAAPSSRNQPMFKGFQSLSRRENGGDNSGSGMSTWSTNSPSPVLMNERDVGVADGD